MRKYKISVLCILILVFLLAGCQKTDGPENALVSVEKDAYTLSDGQKVSTWKLPGSNDSTLLYLLEDGTELLAVRLTPALGYLNADGSIGPVPDGALDPALEERILSHYETQGALFDVTEYLEQAYREYTSAEDKTAFRSYFYTQNTFISEVGEDTVTCTTQILYPTEKGLSGSDTLIQTFDKQAGG